MCYSGQDWQLWPQYHFHVPSNFVDNDLGGSDREETTTTIMARLASVNPRECVARHLNDWIMRNWGWNTSLWWVDMFWVLWQCSQAEDGRISGRVCHPCLSEARKSIGSSIDVLEKLSWEAGPDLGLLLADQSLTSSPDWLISRPPPDIGANHQSVIERISNHECLASLVTQQSRDQGPDSAKPGPEHKISASIVSLLLSVVVIL